MRRVSIGFVGAGAVGSALAVALAKASYRIAAVASRRQASATALSAQLPQGTAVTNPAAVAEKSDVVFITTPDDAISQVASQLPWRQGQGVVHCSGALTLDVLDPAHSAGAVIGSFHPLYTFPRSEESERSPSLPQGVTFAIEGEGWLRELLEEVALALDGRPVYIKPEDRPLYHASAVMACGYLAALLKAATDLWEVMGFSQEEALQALLPLSRATLENVARLGVEISLTGPVTRGDLATVEKHLEALSRSMPDLMPLYSWLGLHAVEISHLRMDRKDVAKMASLLKASLHHNQGVVLSLSKGGDDAADQR